MLRDANNEDFCQLVWSVDALQSGREKYAKKWIKFPSEAVVTDVANNLFVPKWQLETLVNELFGNPKSKGRHKRSRRLDCSSFDTIYLLRNLLREIENNEIGLVLEKTDVLDTMSWLGHRQFSWQQKMENYSNLYRSAYLFCGSKCSEHFFDKFQLQISDFIFCGFVTYASLKSQPAMPLYHKEYGQIGITQEMFEAALSLISLPVEEMCAVARRKRSGGRQTAYKHSVLRETPCVIFDNRLRAPLPDLIFMRVTLGLYYDLVGSGGAAIREIGEKFELYCLELLNAVWEDVHVLPSIKYRCPDTNQELDSPDIFLEQSGQVEVIAECKSKRMPFAVKFGEKPEKNPHLQTGFDELAKGVFQVWRFIAHARRGSVPDKAISEDVLGVVLTMDNWLSLANRRYSDIIARAHSMANEVGNIGVVDRCEVAFCAIDELEHTLANATLWSFKAAIQDASSKVDFGGWHFAQIHRDHVPNDAVDRPYPFDERLDELLPWWSDIARWG